MGEVAVQRGRVGLVGAALRAAQQTHREPHLVERPRLAVDVDDRHGSSRRRAPALAPASAPTSSSSTASSCHWAATPPRCKMVGCPSKRPPPIFRTTSACRSSVSAPPLRGQQGYDATRYALEIGYRHLDTATSTATRPRSARRCGTAACRARGVRHHEDAAGRAGREAGDARREPAGARRRPRRPVADPLAAGAGQRAGWRAFSRPATRAGPASIGVSNYSTAQIDELIGATGETPVVNQIPWSPSGHDPHAAGRAPRARRGARGLQPAEGQQPARSGAARDRRRARRHGGAGGPALAPASTGSW